MVSDGIRWYSVVFNGIQWSQMVSDGLRWSQMALGGLSQLIYITIEWFKTPKPISGLGWDWDGWMDGWIGSPGGRGYRAPYGANKVKFLKEEKTASVMSYIVVHLSFIWS